jgi:hypothetical protein
MKPGENERSQFGTFDAKPTINVQSSSQMNLDTIKVILTVISGVCWTIVYIEGIRLGFKHKSYAIPFFALALNLAWELLHASLGLTSTPDLQTIINCIWFIFDLGILWTYLKFGRKYFPASLPSSWFPIWTVLVLIASGLVQYAFVREFTPFLGGAYAAFLQNLLMSVLFINILIGRGTREGQSLIIAVSKWIGTLAPTILFGVIGSRTLGGPNFLILVVGALCSVFDIIYIFMLAKMPRPMFK